MCINTISKTTKCFSPPKHLPLPHLETWILPHSSYFTNQKVIENMHFVLKLAFSHPKLEPRYLSKLIDTKHIFMIGGDETKK